MDSAVWIEVAKLIRRVAAAQSKSVDAVQVTLPCTHKKVVLSSFRIEEN